MNTRQVDGFYVAWDGHEGYIIGGPDNHHIEPDALANKLNDFETAARLSAETIAAQQAHAREVEGKLAVLIRESDEVLAELDDRADVTDGPDGRPAPSWTMSLANTLRDALTAARR